MKHMIQWVRSLLFNFLMYLALVLIPGLAIPVAIFNRNFGFKVLHFYCHTVRWLAEHVIGLRTEVRGTVPQGEVIVAAKHQSFLDVIVISSVLPRMKFIMKSELRWVPILSFYARLTHSIPVARGKRGAAIKKMIADVKAGRSEPGQLVIFPQGTRVAAGAKKPYKIGAAVLYQETGQSVVPAGTNVGVFWPRHGVMRKPGLAVIEFMPPIEPGYTNEEFMAKVEEAVEGSSNRLMAEAGFEMSDAQD